MHTSYRLCCVFLSSLVLSDCSSAPPMVVPDAEGINSISGASLGCGEPWNLTRDCSAVSGAQKKIDVSGLKLGVAGSDDGRTTLMMGGLTGSRSNSGYEAMKRILTERGITVQRVTPVVSAGTVFGYILQADEPSYAIWSEFARK